MYKLEASEFRRSCTRPSQAEALETIQSDLFGKVFVVDVP